jgi:hypothetical protein
MTTNRTPSGVPAGGEFAAHNRDHGTVELGLPQPATDSIDEVLAIARSMEIRAVASDVVNQAAALFPTATSVQLRRDAFGHWEFSHVLGGETPLTYLTSPGGKFMTEDAAVWMLDESVKPLIDRFGNSDVPISEGVVTADLRLQVIRGNDISRVDAQIAAAVVLLLAADAEIAHLSSEGIRLRIQARFPDAAKLTFREDSWDNGTLFSAGEIVDAHGATLWDSGSCSDDDYLYSELNDLAMNLTADSLEDDQDDSDYYINLV